MAQADWTFLTNSLAAGSVTRGVTAGITKPNGGGNFVHGFNSLAIVTGVVALHNNQVNFVPMAKGGSIRAALKRGASGGNTGFAPLLFIGLQGGDVSDVGYILGLADDEPAHIVLRKGALTGGLPDAAPNPPTNDILLRSTNTYPNDTWVHLRLDMILQGTGDVLLQVYENDLDANPVTAPVWATPAGMEGPQSPTIDGFVDDSLGVNTGSVPYTSGRAGFGMQCSDVTRRVFFDHVEVARQL